MKKTPPKAEPKPPSRPKPEQPKPTSTTTKRISKTTPRSMSGRIVKKRRFSSDSE
jgi:hypothetical protein